MSGENSSTDNKTDETKQTSTDANANGAGSDKGGATGDDTKAATDKGTEDTAGLKSALRKERERADKAEKAIRDQELAKLPELERLRTENTDLANENDKLKLENTKMKLGMELGLKWNVAKRISGDTEEDMRKDAGELLRSLRNEDEEESKREKDKKDRDAVNKAKTNDGAKSGGTGGRDMNALLRAAAGRKPL